MEQPKETPEQQEKRIRKEIQDKMNAEKPEDVPPTLDPSGAKGKKSSDSGMGGMKMYFIIAGISLIIAFLVVTFVGVSGSKFTNNINALNTSITAAQKSVTNLQNSLTNVTNGETTDATNIQAAVNDTNTKLTAVNNQITALQSSTAGIANIQSQLSSFVKTTDLTTELKSYASPDQITALNASLASLQKTLAALQTEVTADEAIITTQAAQIKALQTVTTATTTTNTTTTTTTPVGSVTAAVVPNAFGGGQTMSFAGLPNTTSTPNTESGNFSFSITNSTGATANNIQLAVILETLAGNGTTNSLVDLTQGSYAATVSVSLNGYITSWQQQATGQVGVLGFENVIPSGILANLGTISEPSGNTANPFTVTVTVSITPTATSIPVPSFTIVPLIKVVSYTK
jgi:hypothetical protein